MKVGLMGGMFDPVHLGHIESAKKVAQLFSLNKLLFVPSFIPPHKDGTHATAKQRCKMLSIAIKSEPLFDISSAEIDRGSTSYTIDTIKELQDEFGSSLYFIIGADAFSEIDNWKDSVELFKSCNFIVISRPGSDLQEVVAKFKEKFDNVSEMPIEMKEGFGDDSVTMVRSNGSDFSVYFCSSFEIDISSTAVRKILNEGKDANALLPEGVGEFIEKERVYNQ